MIQPNPVPLMTGISRAGPVWLGGLDHLRQSILDILTTPVGVRVMRPEYGSRLYRLVDRPVNGEFLVDLYYETVVAINRWEPRIRVTRVRALAVEPGRVTLDMFAVYRSTGQPIQVTGLEVALR